MTDESQPSKALLFTTVGGTSLLNLINSIKAVFLKHESSIDVSVLGNVIDDNEAQLRNTDSPNAVTPSGTQT